MKLRDRLEKRMVNPKEDIEKRLEVAVKEIKKYPEYAYVIVNNIFDNAFTELKSIIIANRAKTKRVRHEWIKEFFLK